jgi:hypothetical protein
MAGFIKATKHAAKLRLALIGASGSGKTYTALSIASAMVAANGGGKIAVIDTEHGSASKYSDLFDFDVLELENFDPRKYIEALELAERAGYDIVIVDSLSHAWNGTGGAMEMVDKASERSRGNSFAAWKDVTPLWNQMLDKIIRCKCHVIGTMRAKTEYVLEVGHNGKSTPKKHGMAPIFREGGDYEFDVVGEISIEHTMTVTKTRCPQLADQSYRCAGADVAAILTEWLQGAPVPHERQNNNPKTISTEEAGDLDALGTAVYGDAWPSKRGELVSKVTKGFTDDYMLLNAEEGARLVEGLRKKQAESVPA